MSILHLKNIGKNLKRVLKARDKLKKFLFCFIKNKCKQLKSVIPLSTMLGIKYVRTQYRIKPGPKFGIS